MKLDDITMMKLDDITVAFFHSGILLQWFEGISLALWCSAGKMGQVKETFAGKRKVLVRFQSVHSQL